MKSPAFRNDLSSLDSVARTDRPAKAGWLQQLAKRLVIRQLSGMRHGSLTMQEGGSVLTFGETSQQGALHATVYVHDPRFYAEIAFGGSIGAGEAYMLGYWSADNLTAVIRLMAVNQDTMDNLEQGWAWLSRPLLRVLHWLNRNSKDGSRRNIAAHYDLGNELFETFLDPTMMYSCALFTSDEMSLEQASIAKLDAICRKLQLNPSDHVIEIGTGWGGFALHAAKNYGCRVTTTTISSNQYELARERIRKAGLEDRVTVLLSDYRELTGSYDKLVSIEMIEAVGHAYYDTFFEVCSRLLKPQGMMLLQSITIRDQRYESALRSVDFIQRYIFPGSCIPSVTALLNSATRASDLRLFQLEDIGPHYARTLAEWRHNFLRNLGRITDLGYSRMFMRMWEFYLCYCEGGFEERALGDVHMLLVKPDNRVKLPAIVGAAVTAV